MNSYTSNAIPLRANRKFSPHAKNSTRHVGPLTVLALWAVCIGLSRTANADANAADNMNSVNVNTAPEGAIGDSLDKVDSDVPTQQRRGGNEPGVYSTPWGPITTSGTETQKVVAFAPGQSTLADADKAALVALSKSWRADGNPRPARLVIAGFADELTKRGNSSLDRKSVSLADARIAAVKDMLEAGGFEGDEVIVNLARGNGFLERMFNARGSWVKQKAVNDRDSSNFVYNNAGRQVSLAGGPGKVVVVAASE